MIRNQWSSSTLNVLPVPEFFGTLYGTFSIVLSYEARDAQYSRAIEDQRVLL